MKLEMVQSLRGVAAMMVVLLHLTVFLGPDLSKFLMHGYLGVDIFFVLSGFIIYVSTERMEARDSRVFLFRRFCRVVLPAWVAMFVTALVQPPYLKSLIYGVLFVPQQNSMPPFFGYSFLIVAWTLTYELVFYAIFAAVMSRPWGRLHRGLAASAVLLACVGAVQLLTQTFTLDPRQGPLVTQLPQLVPAQLLSLLGNPILLEFPVGIFLGWAYLSGVFARVRPWMLAPMALLLYLVLEFQFREGHGLTRGGLLAVLIVCATLMLQGLWLQRRSGAVQRERSWRAMLGAPAILLGDISYSLYLIHPAVKSLVVRFAPVAPPAQFVLALGATILLALLFYRRIELPAQNLGRRLSSAGSVRPITA